VGTLAILALLLHPTFTMGSVKSAIVVSFMSGVSSSS
jgi:hypothetical protein